ncbi:hypothetical protein [Desulfovibrio ferrophilus]|uniref:Uncharacterized protein n=1 Tax=Desulfovibrio ferrophilus TaxID=241368 RepID=A0A2Z6AUE5_9BACT|nr:hypothetical protein [Desulfovibrio ferrophilus]BBD06849.1 uncharacterized protein DFE_0123 [Desulfovibrio ferrophilus]
MESGWFVIIGAVIGALPAFVISKMNNNAHDKRQLRQLALEMAINERNAVIDVAKAKGRHAGIPPQSAFLPVAYASVQAFLSGDVNSIDFEKTFAEINKLASESQTYAEKFFIK